MLPDQLDQLKKYVQVLMTPSPHLADEVVEETLTRLQGGPHRMVTIYETCNEAGLAVAARHRT